MDRQNNRNERGHETTAELLARLDALLDEDWKVSLPGETSPQETQPRQVRQPRAIAPKSDWRRGGWLILCHDLVYILAAVLLVFTFFVRMSRVEGRSMYPTLVNHDQMLLLSNIWYSSPQRGDIVVARIPEFSDEPIVKRVIALEGDTVDIDFVSGTVYVNGQALEEPYIFSPTYNDFGADGITYPLTVDKGHVFLMGDNRNDSYDSRYCGIGQVDERCILGKVFFLTVPGKDLETGKRDLSRFGFTG